MRKYLQSQLWRFILLIFFACIKIPSHAQQTIILQNDSDNLKIGKSIYFLKDEQNKLTINDILSHKYDAGFKQYNKDIPNFGNVQLTTWNRFTVKNNSSLEWYLIVDNYNLDTLNFFFPDSSGNYRGIVSGRSIPVSHRKYKSNIYIFDLPFHHGDSAVFYLRVVSYFMQYPMVLMSKEQFVDSSQKKEMLEGFYFGFLFFIVLYNLFVYFSVKDKVYLHYILYVANVGLLVAQLKGYVSVLWGDNLSFMWQYSPAIISLTSIVTFSFSQHILETKKNTPVINRIINYFFYPAYLFIALLSVLHKELLASTLNQLIGMVALVFLYATAIIIYRKGFKFARFYIAASWCYFLGVLIYVLKAFTILPFTDFTNNAIEFGSTLEMILFSFMIADKINTYKKEKSKAQQDLLFSLQENERIIKEQNKMLEIKVEERTSELKQTLNELEISEQQLQEKNLLITKEMERSDHLLLNILPFETAQELKEKGSADAKYFDEVTVMFTDFKDFTSITTSMQPTELVAELDHCFRAFDSIIEKNKIEKIKTIGDSYMAAGGLPVPDSQSPKNTVKAAIEILFFMEQYNRKRNSRGKPAFEIRIGIHTGPLIAGIVGTKKFAYDIWGDTVNTASRMESSGHPGRVNISETTYAFIRECAKCIYRGKVEAKNKGYIDMYFVDEIFD